MMKTTRARLAYLERKVQELQTQQTVGWTDQNSIIAQKWLDNHISKTIECPVHRWVEEKLRTAAARQPFMVDERVAYTPGRAGVLWHGVIIRTPARCRQFAKNGTLLVYVMRDRDCVVRGCCAHNLVRV